MFKNSKSILFKMVSSLTNYKFGGKVVYSPNGKTPIGRVDYLRYDALGREIIKWIRATFKGNEFLQIHTYDEDMPIWGGTILFEGAVSSALDALGITNIHTATPKQVMGVMRSQDFEDVKETENDFGVIITGNREYKDDCTLYQNVPYANYLVVRAQIREEALPVAMFQLRSVPDKTFESGVRLDYFEEKSFWLPAQGLGETNDAALKYFITSKNMPIESILKDTEEQVRIPNLSNLDAMLSNTKENQILVQRPLSYWGLSALVRRGDKILATDNNIGHYLMVDMKGRVLLAFKN